MDKKLLEVLKENDFRVYEDSMELEDWTSGGYDVIITVEDWTEEKVMEAINDFDPNHEVEIWWHDKEFQCNYNYSMAEALEDMEEWKRDKLKGMKEILHPVEMQSASMYLTVRVDISFPKDMNKEDAFEAAYESFDYDFKLKDKYRIDVDGMEICGVNEEEE